MLPESAISMSLYPYHRQDLPEWCGAACIQMLLNYYQQLPACSGQRPLHEATRDPAAKWNASPDKMLTLINQSLPDDKDYELVWKPVNHAAGATLAETEAVLAAVKASAADGVLIPAREYKHWVAVTGALVTQSPHSSANQLHLVVNDPCAAGGTMTAHSPDPCQSGVCGYSPEIWGPVKVSDFLMQQAKGSICLRRPGKVGSIKTEIKDALEGSKNGPVQDEEKISEAAMKHFEFFYNIFKGDLKYLKDGVVKPRLPSANSVSTGASLTSPYPDRWQVRLVDKAQPSAPRFCVWVELCAVTLRLSRVRYVDNQPDWWAGGAAWL
jgi:hypothetical protein